MILSKRFGLPALFLAIAAGCGGPSIYPVHGRVVDMNGEVIKELTNGAVEFECIDAPMSANSPIDADGKFRLSTKRPGDGAHVGKHKVVITRPYFGPDKPAPFAIDPKYERPDTSSLVVTVEPKDNDVTLKVERYRGQ